MTKDHESWTHSSAEIRRAYEFARAAHESVAQLRKYTKEPYIVHPVAVAELVATVPHTKAMLQATLLHDTVEDTNVTLEDIEREFGGEVRELVYWLTDASQPMDGNRAVRKAIDREHISKAPVAAKTIKLADLIHNSQTILAFDRKFAMVYMPEKAALLEVLADGDSTLYERAVKQVGLWAGPLGEKDIFAQERVLNERRSG